MCGSSVILKHFLSSTEDSEYNVGLNTLLQQGISEGLFLFLPLLEIHIPVIPTL